VGAGFKGEIGTLVYIGIIGSREGFAGVNTRREENEIVVRGTRAVGEGRTGVNKGYMLLIGID
jgi:hypothetical protein